MEAGFWTGALIASRLTTLYEQNMNSIIAIY
jgi:hypothetical protein